ncbi:unnamed protein product, partial [Boreogadus saida]
MNPLEAVLPPLAHVWLPTRQGRDVSLLQPPGAEAVVRQCPQRCLPRPSVRICDHSEGVSLSHLLRHFPYTCLQALLTQVCK